MERARVVLFVDDEPNVLSGLRRMLRSLRRDWTLEFVDSGEKALSFIETNDVDVIVSDMRMPYMDGAELLHRVKEGSPHTVRFVLSGQADERAITRSLSVAHQYISKPCDPDDFERRLVETLRSREIIAERWVREMVSKSLVIATNKESLATIESELNQPTPSLARLADCVTQDIALTARCLQFTNSSFFGRAHRTASAAEALHHLGIDTLRLLMTNPDIVTYLPPDEVLVDISSIARHSVTVAHKAASLAASEGLGVEETRCAYTAGLLHEIGRLILVLNAPDAFRRVLDVVATGADLDTAERSVLGATHAEIGGSLLALWGVPEPIVRAVTYHRTPHLDPCGESPLLTTVHVANFLVDALTDLDASKPIVTPDEAYLATAHREHWVAVWRSTVEAGSGVAL